MTNPSTCAHRGETVAVCTIKKANMAINQLVEEKRMGEAYG